MNRFERQSRHPADRTALPENVAVDLQNISRQVKAASAAAPPQPMPLSQREVRTILMSLLLT
ncbi:MAG TPA: MFS transporter, partial [Bradyrhizobium sp.]|nr:MFS transporter [Bradyrhizobium sp.]